ncbi:hypothetical protein B0H19DRAFT_954102, partial [Mycena capillaripes]
RSTKRARATSSSTNTAEATRVIALWRSDGNYYSGRVHSQVSAERYKVHFDDDTESDVKLEQMRLCIPRVGDGVFIAQIPRAVKIKQIVDEESVVVDIGNNSSQTVHVWQLRFLSKTVTSDWTDRLVTAESVVCLTKPSKSFASPTASRFSISSVASAPEDLSPLFLKHGFCITHTSDADKEKQTIAAAIKSHGGVVIDDWEELLVIKGKRLNTRWTFKDSDVGVNAAFHEVQRVFLLAEDATQTPKYLIALALGIPCLRMDFIADAVRTKKYPDWMTYLLPSGYSDCYACRVSQFVNVEWGDSPHDIPDIKKNPVAFKAFSGKKILCVSNSIFEGGPKVVLDSWQNVHAAIPKIMLAMGGTHVEAVPEVKYAALAATDYDYIVNKDNNAKVAELRNCTIVSWDWVKDVLISRCIPPIN